MCGLIGQFTFEAAQASAAEREIVRRLAARAARRGPDGEGFWSDEAHCTLAFRRLAILDLSRAGAQPMSTPDGRYTLVYNGELYNFRELRRELESGGARFRSSGDTEVVLQALATWGRAALEGFNGMFALGLYDRRERTLLLARDHAGMKPLYHLRTARGVVFASQYDQILAHPWSRDLGLSEAAVGLYLRLGYIPAPHAPLRGSHLLPAGSWLEVDAGGREKRGRFFELPVWREPDLAGGAANEAVEAAVRAAVRRHLVADVPVGVFLSGGVDSPLVAATMRDLTGAPVRAFTLGTGGDELDESADAAEYARALGAEHYVEDLTPERALAMLDDVVDACAEPLADYSIFPVLFVSRLARRHVKVALSGDGGDELFWGYTDRFGALLHRLDLPAQAVPGKSPRWSWTRLLDAASPGDLRWPSSIGDLHRISHTHASEGWLRRVFPDLPPWPDDFDIFSYDGRDVERTAQWLRWNEVTGYLTMLLQKVDRGSMFHSLEVRCPLLDREVIDVATRVHWRTCLDAERRIGKLPLRRALAKHVPSQTSAKRGFTVPMGAWLRGPLRRLFEDEVLSRGSLAGLACNRAALRERFERHLAGAGAGWMLWLLLSLALWEKKHLGRRPEGRR